MMETIETRIFGDELINTVSICEVPREGDRMVDCLGYICEYREGHWVEVDYVE